MRCFLRGEILKSTYVCVVLITCCLLCIQRANHRLSTNVQRRIYGRATDAAIRPLNEEKAVHAAADLLGVLFVFTVAGSLVIFEVQRSSRSEARKEELRRQELEALKRRDDDIAQEIEILKQKVEEVEALLEALTKERGLTGLFHYRQLHSFEAEKPKQS